MREIPTVLRPARQERAAITPRSGLEPDCCATCRNMIMRNRLGGRPLRFCIWLQLPLPLKATTREALLRYGCDEWLRDERDPHALSLTKAIRGWAARDRWEVAEAAMRDRNQAWHDQERDRKLGELTVTDVTKARWYMIRDANARIKAHHEAEARAAAEREQALAGPPAFSTWHPWYFGTEKAHALLYSTFVEPGAATDDPGWVGYDARHVRHTDAPQAERAVASGTHSGLYIDRRHTFDDLAART